MIVIIIVNECDAQVGSPPSDMAWTPPGESQHAGSPFTNKDQSISKVTPTSAHVTVGLFVSSCVLCHVFVIPCGLEW